MRRKRLLAVLAAAALALGGLAVAVPMQFASAAACEAAWSSSAVYTKGMSASYSGRNWTAKWWTQNETPGGSSGVWEAKDSCGGGGNPPGNPPPAGGNCNHPNWAAGTWYPAGSIVRYTDGQYYKAEHDNPGYDPIISTWFWDPYSCNGGPQPTDPPPGNSGFVVSEAQFNQMFPGRNSFYTYQGLVAALSAYPKFASAGGSTIARQEAAAFLANVHHETGGLVYVTEINKGNYCDTSRPYGCPAGVGSYYGRGPIQLSWNFNYKAAGDALGIDLLNRPHLVEQDAAVAWKTGLWYWNTQNGPGSMTPHDAMVNQRGFGETIRSINGALECGGRNTAQVQSRVTKYQSFVGILGVSAGDNLYC